MNSQVGGFHFNISALIFYGDLWEVIYVVEFQFSRSALFFHGDLCKVMLWRLINALTDKKI